MLDCFPFKLLGHMKGNFLLHRSVLPLVFLSFPMVSLLNVQYDSLLHTRLLNRPLYVTIKFCPVLSTFGMLIPTSVFTGQGPSLDGTSFISYSGQPPRSGAQGGTRTHTPVITADFESALSTSSNTWA